jgi:lysophospholipase L1-like esterase
MSLAIPLTSKLVMIGDSITDCGRGRPAGEGDFDGSGLGTGYVAHVNSLLRAAYPQARVRVVNMGTSGNTVRDLAARWQTDVLDLEPDWLSIMIGINDVWRQFDSPLRPDQQVGLDEYTATLRELAAGARPKVQGLVMMTPYFIEPLRADPMRARMDEYGAVVKRIAAEVGAILVDTQAAFDAALIHQHPMTIAWDRVHPSPAGHMLLARAFLNAVGFEW